MGTRADFYVGRGKDAEWLGSIAWDGYPDGIATDLLEAKTEEAYRDAVADFFADDRDDVSGPDHGWPWPWEDSNTTDYAYAFDGDGVYVTCFGHGWDHIEAYDPDDETTRPKVEFPDMSKFKHSAPAGSKRSGVMLFSMLREEG